jgi:phosphatidylserine decarboxylase
MTFLQYLLPQHLLSKLMFRFARIENVWVKNTFTHWFINKYQVNLVEAESDNISDYAHFNDFFTRALKPQARPISESTIISPVDGVVSQAGQIKDSQILQAKGHHFYLSQLLAGEPIEKIENGYFATIYLAPKDYHRIHMPFDGKLVSMRYVPGNLFSVNHKTVNKVNEVFARNERLVCLFDTVFGRAVFVMVGAIFVGSMETSWQGQVTPPYGKAVKVYDYTEKKFELFKGGELGRFNMGSTIIMLLPETAPTLKLQSGQELKMGQSLI